MGTVYRARDLDTGRRVALKVLRSPGGPSNAADRFHREARLLSELHHPGIVRYVSHGQDAGGHAYLVMEWLPGEDLKHRLSRGRLRVAEALVLARKIAAALATAHERGIIHRDIKPSNLLLRDGELERVMLLDFGIARRAAHSHVLTKSGVVLGTPQYMAPEQARGDRALTPAADIFSFGAILFECLAGKPPFSADHLAAVLAKILFEKPTRLQELDEDIPDEVDRLVSRMLAKDPAERPADAATLLSEIPDLTEPQRRASKPLARRRSAAVLVDSDQRLVSVLVATPLHVASEEEEEATLDTDAVKQRYSVLALLRRELEEHGARVERLVDGSLVATFLSSRGSATDLVAQAARAALLVRERCPSASVSLSTGRGAITGELPVGEAFDRAAKLLRVGAVTADRGRVLLDELTAGLLDARFRTRSAGSGTFMLDSAELDADESRLLLGKPTPYVGREPELLALEGALRGCVEELQPRVVLVTGPPGMGKSRLRHEFLRRVAARGEKVLVLVGRGDPLTTSSSYGMLGQALRRLCSVQDGEPLEIRREKVRKRVTARSQLHDAGRAAEFLGELCGIPFPDADSPRLRAARQDPQLMGEQVKEALLDLLRLECATQPVVLVLEDLHWGDALTVRLIGKALTELGELPLLVLATARPELSDAHAKLWVQPTQHLSLVPLSKRASERLVRQVLGEEVTPEVVSRISEQAAGNALFLEELIRAKAVGYGEEPPGTILAMLQARISRLDAGARRVLRAASIFGETFWLGGLRSLLGSTPSEDDLAEQLSALVADEIVAPRSKSRFLGEHEYRFRHALMSDAARALLTEEERREGHGLCLNYLERAGESDPILLCEHAVRCGDQERALPYLIRAAQRAFERCDVGAVERFVDLGLRGGARGEARGALLAPFTWVLAAQQRCSELFDLGTEAMSLLPRGSSRWCFVVAQCSVGCRLSGSSRVLDDLVAELRTAVPDDDAIGFYSLAVWTISSNHVLQGKRAQAQEHIKRCAFYVDRVPSDQSPARAFLLATRSLLAFRLEPDPFGALADGRAAKVAIEQSGHRHYRLLVECYLAVVLNHVGRHDEALEMLHRARMEVEGSREPMYVTMAAVNLITCLSETGTAETTAQAVSLARAILADEATNKGLITTAQPYIAAAMAAQGLLPQAETTAREALSSLKGVPPYGVMAYATLSTILLLQGRGEEARHTAEEGLLLLESMKGSGVTEVPLRLAVAEARHGCGDVDGARKALRAALDALRERAQGAPDAASRALYLTGSASNRRVLELAQRWLGERVV